MAFEENNPGFWTPENEEDSITGVLIKVEDDVGQNKSKLYHLEVDGKPTQITWAFTRDGGASTSAVDTIYMDVPFRSGGNNYIGLSSSGTSIGGSVLVTRFDILDVTDAPQETYVYDDVYGWTLLRDGFSNAVKKSGDTMTGNLTLDGTSTIEVVVNSASDAHNAGIRIRQGGVTKWLIAADNANRLVVAQYDKTTGSWVRSAIAIDGDSGNLSAYVEPTANSHVATKRYVDDSLSANSAWAEYAPTVTQGVSVSVDWYPMRYVKIGRLVIVSGLFRCTSSGTSGQPVTFTAPVAARLLPGTRVIGSAYINNGGITAAVMLDSNSSNLCRFRLATGGDYNTQITNGWVASVSLMYESAA